MATVDRSVVTTPKITNLCNAPIKQATISHVMLLFGTIRALNKAVEHKNRRPMARFTHFLFPVQPRELWPSWLLLALRLLFGVLLLRHGIEKWIHFEELEINFPDPLGVGSRFSLMLCLFAEAICSCFVIVGLFTRLMLIPIVLNMLIALLVIHHGEPFAARELSLLYLLAFVVLMIFGPGRFSCDAWIGRQLSPRLKRYNERS